MRVSILRGILLIGVLSACSAVKNPSMPPEAASVAAEPPKGAQVIREEDHLNHFAELAALGDAQAAYTLARHHQSRGKPQQADSWWRRAAELGHAEAQYYLWVTRGPAPSCRPLLDALAWLERAAGQQHPAAMAELGAGRDLSKKCSGNSGQLPPNNSFKPKPLRGSA